MSFFRQKPKKYKKERELNDDSVKNRSFDNTDIESNNEKEVAKLFSDIKEDIDLGNELLQLFDDKCRATYVPVPEELQDIRAAVIRKDSAEPNGARISFALFITAVKKYEELKLEYSLTVVDTLSGNPDLDATRVSSLKSKVLNGVAERDLILFSSLWMLNYTLNKYQDIFNLPKMAEIAASPQSAGISAAKMVAATAFASAVDVIYSELLNENNSALDRTVESINSEKLSRLDNLALKKISENDYDLILDYVIRYIYTTTDQKYNPWTSYIAVRKSRNSSIDMYSYYPTYSSSEFIKVNAGQLDGYEKTDLSATDLIEDKIKANFEQKLKDSLYTDATMIGSGSENMYRQISAKNRMVFNTAAQSSAYKVTKDQICCFIRILTKISKIDKDIIKMLRCLIKVSSGTLSVQLSIGFSNKVINQLKGLDINAMIVNRIKGILSSMIKEIYERLLLKLNAPITSQVYAKCYMFLNLFEGMSGGLDDVVSGIQKEFLLENNKIQRSLVDSQLALQTKFQIRILNDIELMLTAILDESLEECALMDDSAAEEVLDEVISGFNVPSNQYTIDISDKMRQKYFSDSKPIRLLKKSSTLGERSELVIPAIDKINLPETSEEIVRNILRTCKIDVTDDQIKQMLKDTDGSSR